MRRRIASTRSDSLYTPWPWILRCGATSLWRRWRNRVHYSAHSSANWHAHAAARLLRRALAAAAAAAPTAAPSSSRSAAAPQLTVERPRAACAAYRPSRLLLLYLLSIQLCELRVRMLGLGQLNSTLGHFHLIGCSS